MKADRSRELLSLAAFLCTLTMAACSPRATIGSTYAAPTGTSTSSPACSVLDETPTAPLPDPGKASVSAVLYSLSGSRAIPGTVYYLTPARGQEGQEPPAILTGPHTEEGDIRGVTGPQGQVTLDSIAPGSYFLVVWAPYKWILASESGEDSTPRLIVLEAGEHVDLGTIDLWWP